MPCVKLPMCVRSPFSVCHFQFLSATHNCPYLTSNDRRGECATFEEKVLVDEQDEISAGHKNEAAAEIIQGQKIEGESDSSEKLHEIVKSKVELKSQADLNSNLDSKIESMTKLKSETKVEGDSDADSERESGNESEGESVYDCPLSTIKIFATDEPIPRPALAIGFDAQMSPAQWRNKLLQLQLFEKDFEKSILDANADHTDEKLKYRASALYPLIIPEDPHLATELIVLHDVFEHVRKARLEFLQLENPVKAAIEENNNSEPPPFVEETKQVLNTLDRIDKHMYYNKCVTQDGGMNDYDSMRSSIEADGLNDAILRAFAERFESYCENLLKKMRGQKTEEECSLDLEYGDELNAETPETLYNFSPSAFSDAMRLLAQLESTDDEED
ncbi:unnamed protein product [Caenorhabditis bovis]|uniref:Uncharacterized protein n=1 Tax=Caenorhabditis bovis TaxID=2654633 RepID=A0A8S1FDI6_9PELO|nr:unnamed protein product [Caenorhabditis bovis]